MRIQNLRQEAKHLRSLNRRKRDSEQRLILRIIDELERIHKELERLQQQRGMRAVRRPNSINPYSAMTTIQAALTVLSEGEPMNYYELVVEIMERGHRAHDEPQAVLKNLKASMQYHRGKFVQDGEGRWSVKAMGAMSTLP